LLTNLPCRQLGKAGGGLVRRLSGGVDVPHRMTPIAEAAPEPKPLPLHVQVAARDVMTGGCVWFQCNFTRMFYSGDGVGSVCWTSSKSTL
jgi:hypothetical protein